ncbi:glycosyltransferase family 2 protein [Aeromonas enteropelogenes]|uniref:glycosyltransferase family 2 protein n=1 Tax=Aeromonas enteropelogenes TaxID=29489 RepID=UPI002285E9D6|nr:glycosyltransferase family 2 protein [Aeromonas enteropelogenes]MCZ0750703.1 glycosyltransferase family 2 protein [Aeromonas enteropelogenes]
MTKLTVLMPVFNAEVYLSSSICSILSQTYGDFKFIVLDDGSTDNSLRVIEGFAKNDERIVVKSHNENKGIAKCRDELLSLVDTEYFAWMDADDISFPHRFKVQIDYLESHPEIGAVSAGYIICDSQERYIPESDPDKIAVNMLTGNAIINPVTMVRTDVAVRTGFLFEHCGVVSATDYAFWVSMRDAAKLKVLPECLLIYRVHKQQESSANVCRQQYSAKLIVAKQFASFGLNVDERILEDLVLFSGDKPSKYSLIEIGRLYSNLISINEKNAIFIQHLLISSLSSRYMSYCKFFGLAGVFNYLKFMGLKSLLDKKKFGFDFLVRCLTYQSK